MKIVIYGNFDLDYSSETYYAKTLEAMGHDVHCYQEGQQEPDKEADLFVWVHGHGRQTDFVPPPGTISWHHDLFFGLDRQADLERVAVYKDIEHFFTTDKNMAEWFNQNTKVKGHYLPSGVFDQECAILEPTDGLPKNDVAFFGNKGYHPQWPYRPQLINWLQETYGDGFGWYSTEAQSKGVRRGVYLNQQLANTKVVVGDSLCPNFDYPDYWSDRVWETLGRGGFLIHPRIKGLEDYVTDGEHLVLYEYGNFDQLKELIDYYLQTPHERERIRQAGHEHVKNNHTYTLRWKEILNEVSKN